MFNPFSLGNDWLRAGLDSWQLAMKMGETASAAGFVIDRRLRMMAAAGATPTAADMREMNLMVSEKTKAFAKAASSLGTDFASLSPAGWVGAYSAALEPIHGAATANARRLKRKRA